jgi:hypothetical protein
MGNDLLLKDNDKLLKAPALELRRLLLVFIGFGLLKRLISNIQAGLEHIGSEGIILREAQEFRRILNGVHGIEICTLSKDGNRSQVVERGIIWVLLQMLIDISECLYRVPTLCFLFQLLQDLLR